LLTQQPTLWSDSFLAERGVDDFNGNDKDNNYNDHKFNDNGGNDNDAVVGALLSGGG
jgi:hypothetical protein